MTVKNLKEMMSLQDELNKHLFADWRERNLDFGMAIAAEAMELADHIGWKWWKATPEPSPMQVHLELVDIWHFLLSTMLEDDIGDDIAAKIVGLFAAAAERADELEVETIFIVRDIAKEALAANGMAKALASFIFLCTKLRLSFDELHRLYKAKAVLNLFRWDNGYREGTYIKTWFGEEDNVYLEKTISVSPEASAAELTAHLAARYLDVTQAQGALQ